MKLKTIDLPRKYQYKEGISRPEYKKYDNWNYFSVSQFSSFTDEMYRGGYIGNYFLGVKDEGNIFSFFGGICGEYYETGGEKCDEYLSTEDTKVLNTLPRPETAKYETEIAINMEPFGVAKTIILGYIDSEDEVKPKSLIITDLKTGNHKDKLEYYGSDLYSQTTIYCYARDIEGYKILKSQVYLLERLGNTLDRTAFSKAGNPLWLRLSGKMEIVPTPYTRDRAENYLREMAKTIVEISDYYKIYKTHFCI